MNNRAKTAYLAAVAAMALTAPAWAMHIMEGYLSPVWSGLWIVLCIPFVFYGIRSIRAGAAQNPKYKIILAMSGAFAFVLSALKIPSVVGSCSHPTGVGFGTILLGPMAMSVVGLVVLLFQALLLAHGGLTTLGANTFSMAIAGPIVCFLLYKLTLRLKGSKGLAIFVGSTVGSLFTYVVTSVQLAVAYPSEVGGILASLQKFIAIFAYTQLPISIAEGIITVLVFRFLKSFDFEELQHALS